MAQTFRMVRLEINAPPEGDILPRWRYNAKCVGNTDGEVQEVRFLSTDESPESPVDTCNTIDGLLVDGELDFDCSELA